MPAFAQFANADNKSFSILPDASFGFNLSSADITGAGAGKYYGVAEKAEALVIAGETIPATNFIRNDATSQSLYPITVKNNGGI